VWLHCAYFGRSFAERVFRARVSPPRGPLVIRLTCEIRTRPRCRNGRTTFTRRNWRSKRNATTVSRYFPFRRGDRGQGDDLAGRVRETDPRIARSIRVSRVRVNGFSSPSPASAWPRFFSASRRRGRLDVVARATRRTTLPNSFSYPPSRFDATSRRPLSRVVSVEIRGATVRFRVADRYDVPVVAGGVPLWRRRTRYRLVSFATVDPARPARPLARSPELRNRDSRGVEATDVRKDLVRFSFVLSQIPCHDRETTRRCWRLRVARRAPGSSPRSLFLSSRPICSPADKRQVRFSPPSTNGRDAPSLIVGGLLLRAKREYTR